MYKAFDEGYVFENGVKVNVQCFLTKCRVRKKPIEYSLHYHNYIELLYGENKTTVVYLSGKKYFLREGDLLIVNSKEPHAFCTTEENVRHFCIKLSPEILYNFEQSYFEIKYLLPFILKSSPDKRLIKKEVLKETEIGSLFRNIYKECLDKNYGYELSVRADILKIFLWILRYWHQKNIISNEELAYNSEIFKTIFKSLPYIQKNHQTITAKEISAHLNISYSYFSRSFKKVMGINFTDYINYLKISKAEKYLMLSDMSITEIAMNTGFSTTSYFITQFKKAKNISPKQYRKMIEK